MGQPVPLDQRWTEPEIPDFGFWYDPLPDDDDPPIVKKRKEMKAKLTAIVLYLQDLHKRGCFKCSKEVRDRSQRLDTTFQERQRRKTPYQEGMMEGTLKYMDMIHLNPWASYSSASDEEGARVSTTKESKSRDC
jgi:hypothetical protein